ncbi:sugar ABC transporter substrate-binding protein [Aeromicrobium phragmitis]|uniref:Sugar ABC transporter substrate-binding protein n=1 Tax=Aeromicrobium phragmitis TaxID=2478914 RepID=A0A3L8PNL7_9ACTN|nr:sugar ABC transporter substrate-binding protein [Aeromicrobium phragmitis]RLV56931.1 sugar ABC transporter substrate-binding protein [Aeromicrobium phragmitis]
MRRPHSMVLGASALAATLALSACGADGGGSSDGYQIAFLAASSQNGYSQAVYEGIQQAAEDADVEVSVKILDGQFDANTQLSQLQNATTTGQYDGVIVVPNDGPSLAAAFPLPNEMPVATVLAPIGPDINEMEPQVEGVTTTVAVPPVEAAAKQAEQVVDYCAELDPCKVVLMLGQLDTPLDTARREAYEQAFASHDNIQVVATVEGGYDRDQAMTSMANVLQANSDFNVLLSNADQDALGATLAIEDAGIDPSSVFITGGGGTKEAVENVKSGRWAADYLNFPVSMGSAAMDQVLNALEGREVESYVNADEVGGTEPYATKETLGDFVGEWNG